MRTQRVKACGQANRQQVGIHVSTSPNATAMTPPTDRGYGCGCELVR